MYGYGYSLYNQVPFGRGGIDPSAAAYFAATGITGATQQTAIDNLVKGLKADGLWSKMKAVYPFVTDQRNLASFTEDFSNAAWTKEFATITANTTTAPDGTTTADTFQGNGANNYHQLIQSGVVLTSGSTYTTSIYAKKNTNNFIQIVGTGNAYPLTTYANFDLNNGVVGSYGANVTPTITSVGNGWYRCTMTAAATLTSSSNSFIVGLITSASSLRVEINTLATSVFLWGAQLELGSTATTYQPQSGSAQAAISSQFKYNLVNPVDSDAAFRLVFNGGWTHSSTGATPNGTNGYADTKLTASANLSLTNTHFSFYSRTNSVDAFQRVDMGRGASLGYSYINLFTKLDTATNWIGGTFGDVAVNVANTNSACYAITSAISSTSAKLYKNGAAIATNTTPSTGSLASTAEIYIGSQGNLSGAGQFSNKQCAFSSIGSGLTDTEAANLYTRVQAFQTALSRNV